MVRERIIPVAAMIRAAVRVSIASVVSAIVIMSIGSPSSSSAALAPIGASRLLIVSPQAFRETCDADIAGAKRTADRFTSSARSRDPLEALDDYDTAVAVLNDGLSRAGLARNVHPDEAMRAALLDEMMHKLRPADASGFPKLRTIDFMLEQDPDHAPLRPDQSWMDRINRAQIEAGRDRWQALIALTRYDLGAALERLACPALLLMGEKFYFGHRAGEIRTRVKDLRYEVLAGARFCASWEKADDIAARARAFALKGG